jgi:hypothetical protein
MVTSRLAMRYDIRLSLKHSSYGGTTAVVLIPRELVQGAEDGTEPGTAPRGVPVAVGAGGMTATSYGDVRVATEAAVLEPPALSAPATEPEAPAEPATPAELPAAPAEVSALVSDGALPPLPRRTPMPQPEPTAAAAPAPAAQTTPGGLPVRVPQASITLALRTDGTPAGTTPVVEEEDGPTPEQIRRSFGGLQAGTRRGRTDAARSQTPAAEPTPVPDEDAEEDNQ